MRNRALLLIFAIFMTSVSATGSEPFSLLGVEIPILDTDFELAENDMIGSSRYPNRFELEFFLNKAGLVDSVISPSGGESAYLRNIQNSLEGLEFRPAMRGGEVIPFILPAYAIFETKFGAPHLRFHFPFEEPQCQADKRLIDKMMELNGYDIPRLLEFPSYFCSFPKKKGDSGGDYPYVVYRIDLDNDGQLIDYDKILIGGPDYSRWTDNALLYAKFNPASLNSTPMKSRIYLTIRYFDYIGYPTGIWRYSDINDSTAIGERMRIESAVYLDSMVNPPIPVNIRAAVFHNTEIIQIDDSVEVQVKINKSGKVTLREFGAFIPQAIREDINEFLGRLRFSPAVDIHGEQIEFDGKLELKFNNSKKIRMIAEWLI